MAITIVTATNSTINPAAEGSSPVISAEAEIKFAQGESRDPFNSADYTNFGNAARTYTPTKLSMVYQTTSGSSGVIDGTYSGEALKSIKYAHTITAGTYFHNYPWSSSNGYMTISGSGTPTINLVDSVLGNQAVALWSSPAVVGDRYETEIIINQDYSITVNGKRFNLGVEVESVTANLSSAVDPNATYQTRMSCFDNTTEYHYYEVEERVDYSIEKDSVEIAQDNTITLTNFDQSQVGVYEIFADTVAGGEKTSLGSVNQQLTTSKKLTFGGQTIPFKAGIGYKTEYELNMHRTIDSLGMIKWVDMLLPHDTIKTSFKSEMLDVDQKTLEEMLKGVYGADFYLAEDIGGFYPFTPYFDYSAGAKFSLVNKPMPKEVNLYGDASHYDLEIIPAYTNGVFTDLPAAGAIPQCGSIPQDWYITSGLWLPFPENEFDDTSLNQDNVATQTNGGYNSTFRINRTAGEIAEIQVEVDEEIARQLMVHFSTVRGGTSEAYFQTGYSPFAHLYPDNNYFTVRLADSVITFTPANHRRVIVDFSIQLVGVIS